MTLVFRSAPRFFGSWRVSDRATDTLVTGLDATIWVWRCRSLQCRGRPCWQLEGF